MFATFSAGNGVLQQRRVDAATYYNFSLQPYGGNVGIGTTTPTTKLHVAGSTTTDYAQLDAGLNFLNVANPSVAATGTPIETDTVRQETGVFKESALVGSAARRHQERRPVVVKRSKAGLARRLVRRLSFRRRRLRAL